MLFNGVGNLSSIFSGRLPQLKKSGAEVQGMDTVNVEEQKTMVLDRPSPLNKHINLNNSIGNKISMPSTKKPTVTTPSASLPKSSFEFKNNFKMDKNVGSLLGLNKNKSYPTPSLTMGKSSVKNVVNPGSMLGLSKAKTNINPSAIIGLSTKGFTNNPFKKGLPPNFKNMLGSVGGGKGFEQMMNRGNSNLLDKHAGWRMKEQQGLPLFGDFDMDKVLNVFDCQPRNPKKQAWYHRFTDRERWETEQASKEAATEAATEAVDIMDDVLPEEPVSYTQNIDWGPIKVKFQESEEALGQQEKYEAIQKKAREDALKLVQKERAKQEYQKAFKKTVNTAGYKIKGLDAVEEYKRSVGDVGRDLAKGFEGGYEGFRAALPGVNRGVLSDAFRVRGGTPQQLLYAAGSGTSNYGPKIQQSVGVTTPYFPEKVRQTVGVAQSTPYFPEKVKQTIGGEDVVQLAKPWQLKVLETIGRKDDADRLRELQKEYNERVLSYQEKYLEQKKAEEEARQQMPQQSAMRSTPTFSDVAGRSQLVPPQQSMQQPTMAPVVRGVTTPAYIGNTRIEVPPGVTPTKQPPNRESPSGRWIWSVKSKDWVTYPRKPYNKNKIVSYGSGSEFQPSAQQSYPQQQQVAREYPQPFTPMPNAY